MSLLHFFKIRFLSKTWWSHLCKPDILPNGERVSMDQPDSMFGMSQIPSLSLHKQQPKVAQPKKHCLEQQEVGATSETTVGGDCLCTGNNLQGCEWRPMKKSQQLQYLESPLKAGCRNLVPQQLYVGKLCFFSLNIHPGSKNGCRVRP